MLANQHEHFIYQFESLVRASYFLTEWIHGEKPIRRPVLDRWSKAMYVIDPLERIQVSGYITKWQFYASRTGKIYLQVYNNYTFMLIITHNYTPM